MFFIKRGDEVQQSNYRRNPKELCTRNNKETERPKDRNKQEEKRKPYTNTTTNKD
jgi:hypothetical protein